MIKWNTHSLQATAEVNGGSLGQKLFNQLQINSLLQLKLTCHATHICTEDGTENETAICPI